ncbi:MAG: amidohydrolase [Janthinobacterium lividum]
MLLRSVRVDGMVVDVRIADGLVAEIAPALPDDGTEVVSGGGAVLLPGLHDEHVHLAQWAAARRRVDLSPARSAAAAAELLAAAAATQEVSDADDLLVGHGFRDALWSDPAHRDVLDARVPETAVVAISQDLHCTWVNSAAAQRFGISEESGVLREGPAMELISAVRTVGEEVQDLWVLAATDAAAARGVTSVVDLEYAPLTDWVRRCAVQVPGFRVRVGVWTDFLDDVVRLGLRSGDALPGVSGTAEDRVRLGPLKLVLDGSLGTRTAFCHDPYPGSTPAGAHGMRRMSALDLETMLRRAADTGLDVAVHAIGDAAVTAALDGFAAVPGAPGRTRRIEHAQQVGAGDLARFAALGVTASVQPRHAVDDRDLSEVHWAAGLDRAYPYAALLAAGADVVLGSDAPVAPLDPWDAIASAIHRTVDDRPAWRPEQHLSLQQALAAASGGRRRVAVGDVADLVLLEREPAEVFAAGGAEALRHTAVLATLLGGEFTHRTRW